MPIYACRSEAFGVGEPVQDPQRVYLLDNDNIDTSDSNYAVLNGSLNFEGKQFQNLSALFSWDLNPAISPLYFSHISQAIEPKFLTVNFERSPPSPSL
jgi:hypothetical protein